MTGRQEFYRVLEFFIKFSSGHELPTQKVALALPFMAEFADRFTDDVRTVLIPSALVLPGQPPELEAVAAAVGGTAAARLRAVECWEDLPRLPRGVRERLVVKCASADPATSSRGRGVSPFWKVAGKDAGWDQNGRVTGSAFVDLRVDGAGSLR